MRITKYVSKNDDNNAIWFKNPYHNRSFRVNDKLKQLMIQKSLRSFHDKKPQSTHDTKIPAKAGRFWSTKTPSNSWFKHPCQGRSFMVNKKPQATHDSKIPANAGRFWSTKYLKQHMIQTSSGRFMTKNLKQHMIQTSLLRQVVSGQRKTSSNSWFKNLSGRLMTRNLKQLMIQTSLPRQVAFGQRNTSSNSWFKNPCQGKSFLVNKKPQATHDSKIPAKTGRFWSTINLKQHMIQKSLLRQVVSGQRNTSSNPWFKHPRRISQLSTFQMILSSH